MTLSVTCSHARSSAKFYSPPSHHAQDLNTLVDQCAGFHTRAMCPEASAVLKERPPKYNSCWLWQSPATRRFPKYSPLSQSEEIFDNVCRYVFGCFENGKDQFHRNIRDILNDCWPGLSFKEQLRRTWVTESVLCSASVECGSIPRTGTI